MATARRPFRSPSRQPAAATTAAGTASGAAQMPPPRPFSGPLRRRWLFAAAAFLAAVVPVACGQRRQEARFAELEAGIASAQASLAALSTAAPSAPPPVGAASFRPAAAVFSSTEARPGAASGLLGAGPDALRRWFGDPDLRRSEGGAEVRLYVGSGCALDVVLYPGAAGGGGMRVAHAAARADGAAAVTEADCLRGIGASGGGGGAGRAAAAGHSGGR